MANRYWVGGTASWDGTAGTKWALTDGGAGGEAEPTSADDVFFTAASGAVTVTIASTVRSCLSLNFTGFTGTLAGSIGLSIYGNLTAATGMTWSYTGTASFRATTTGWTITMNGKGFQGGVTFNGVGGGWTASGAFSCSGATPLLTVINGTFDTGSNVLAGWGAMVTTLTNGVLVAGTSTIQVSNNTNVLNSTDSLASATFNVNGANGTFTLRNNTVVGTINIANTAAGSSASTFNLPNGTATITNFLYSRIMPGGRLSIVTSSGTSTLSVASFTMNGKPSNPLAILGNANNTIAVDTLADIKYTSLKDVIFGGTVTKPILAKHSFNLTGNSNVEFASYPANSNVIRPALFTPGRAR